jgi:hypothetical protein
MLEALGKGVKSIIKGKLSLAEVHTRMLQLMAAESINHYQMGELYNYVVDNNLAENAGYKNAPDWFIKNLCDLSPATLVTYGVVAESFTEEICKRFGVTCLSLVLTYKELAGLELNHEQPGDTLIEVPDDKGVVTTKHFGACSVDEMRRAIQRKRKPTSSKPLPPEHLSLAELYRKAVTGRYAKADRVKVQVRNQKGKTVLDFKGIPLAQVAKLGEVLVAPPPVAQQEPEQDEAPPAN